MAFVNEMGAKVQLHDSTSEGDVHHLDLALLGELDMPSFLAWSVNHVDVLEARPVKLSMAEVFVKTVQNHESNG